MVMVPHKPFFSQSFMVLFFRKVHARRMKVEDDDTKEREGEMKATKFCPLGR